SNLLGTELRGNWRPSATQVATLGTEGRWNYRALQYSIDLNPFYVHSYTDAKSSVGSLYAQDELTMTRARVTAGVRIDSYSRYGDVASPRLDVVVPLARTTAWKIMTGSAYRAPVPYETNYSADDQVANPRLKPERVATLETSIEQHLGRTDLSLSVYRNWIRDLVDTAFLDSTGTFGFVNQDHVVGSGAEGEVGFVSSGGMRGR